LFQRLFEKMKSEPVICGDCETCDLKGEAAPDEPEDACFERLHQKERSEFQKLLKQTGATVSPVEMQVVDEESGETVPVATKGKMNSITFTMDGSHSRTFRWELLSEENSATGTSTAEKKSFSVRSMRVKLRESLGFDLSKPPITKEDRSGK